jgi:predicted DNA-binding protein
MRNLSETVQIKVNLSPDLKQELKIRAQLYGITMAEYVRHLIIKSIEENEEKNYVQPIKEDSIEYFRRR